MYRVDLSPAAQKQLDSLPDSAEQRLRPDLIALESSPRPHGCKKLKGKRNRWRIRVGDFRIVYTIDDKPQWFALWRLLTERGLPQKVTVGFPEIDEERRIMQRENRARGAKAGGAG